MELILNRKNKPANYQGYQSLLCITTKDQL